MKVVKLLYGSSKADVERKPLLPWPALQRQEDHAHAGSSAIMRK